MSKPLETVGLQDPMRILIRPKLTYKYLVLLLLLVLGLKASSFGEVPAEPVTVTVSSRAIA